MGSLLFHILSVLLVLSYSFQLAVPTKCKDPVMFVFGDSNSDTGGNNAIYGGLTIYPAGNIFPSQPSERACNGRLIIDFLCENVTANYLDAYMNAFEPDFANGANFAISGSSATYPAYRLYTQIRQFERFYNRSLDLQSKGSAQKLVGEEGFKRALYIIDIGQNDLANSFVNTSYAGVIERIPMIRTEIKQAVQDIYDKGGRRFWVHNTGPLGCLPIQLAIRKPNATDLDQHGCINYLNEGAKWFNGNLSSLCDEIRNEKKDATIVYVDVYAIKYDLIANPKNYGFDNPLQPCLEANKLCTEQSKHINWDWVHYTEAANAIVASKITSANYSTPPLPFNFFCDDSVY